MLVVGDFSNFRTLIQRHPDYNQQDLRMRKVDEELHNLERFLFAADSGNDLNTQMFVKIQRERNLQM